jgi:hypothetical protein
MKTKINVYRIKKAFACLTSSKFNLTHLLNSLSWFDAAYKFEGDK